MAENAQDRESFAVDLGRLRQAANGPMIDLCERLESCERRHATSGDVDVQEFALGTALGPAIARVDSLITNRYRRAGQIMRTNQQALGEIADLYIRVDAQRGGGS